MEHLPSIHQRTLQASQVENVQRRSFINQLKKIKLPKNSHALSVSVGDGSWDHIVFKNKLAISSILATDIVNNPVAKEDRKLLKKLGNWEFTKVPADKKLPFEDNRFNLIYHCDVLEHVNKPYLFIAEQFRVLKPDGYIIFNTPNLLRPANIAKILLGRLKFPVTINNNAEIGPYIHVQEFTSWNLENLLNEIGFRDVQIYYDYFGICPLNIKFSDHPTSLLGKNMSHYLTAVAKK